MARITRLDLFAVELPFRKPFKHAAAERTTSSSVFLRAETDSGRVGFGESLPREYVTGETRDGVCQLLREHILPRLLELEFSSLGELGAFLGDCDGKAPTDWVAPDQRQTAAWCAVDLALSDAFGRAFGEPASPGESKGPTTDVSCSAVISSEASLKTLLLIRLAGIRQVKLKLERDGTERAVERCRKWLGPACQIRADANMAWTPDEAVNAMRRLARLGVRSFEQPVAADDFDGLARLVAECDGLDVMVDESLHDRESLERLIASRACTAVNIRISKCGGLTAALNRCREALQAGLKLQIGCQVGESSLLSAAALVLVQALPRVDYFENCFGRHLLREDPVRPVLQFGLRGRLPALPTGNGLRVHVDETLLERFIVSRHEISR